MYLYSLALLLSLYILQWRRNVWGQGKLSMDYGRQMKPFLLKSQTFGRGKTNWADKFWGIGGIFGQTISTHFGTVSPLSIFSIIQPLFQQK
jgi:hypothetical protein